MSVAGLQSYYVFGGVRPRVAGNISFQDEQTLVFPTGCGLVLYNADHKQQTFLPVVDKNREITAMQLSPNRRYVIVADCGEKASVIVYDVTVQKRRKVMTHPDLPIQRFVALAISHDNKYLVAQGGEPDWVLMYCFWEKGKVVTTVRPTLPHTSAKVSQVSFHPHDPNIVCVVGSGIFKLYRLAEGTLKQFGFQKSDLYNFLCHAWLSNERIIAGTGKGNMILFENGELKGTIPIHDWAEADKDGSQTESHLTTISEGSQRAVIQEVTAVVAFSKGFACSCGPGMVYLFEKRDDHKQLYRQTRVVAIPDDPHAVDQSRSKEQTVAHLANSPSEETLVASTHNLQLYSINLSKADLSKSTWSKFELFSDLFHRSAIRGMDVCIRKPLVVTCADDHTIRVWNFETLSLELHKEFQDEIYSVALHPSGLYVGAGFTDKLRLMNLLIDDIRTFREFSVRSCGECSFSHGGHLFAAAHGNVIQLFSTATFENTCNLKGHNGKVQSVMWSADDLKLVSCGLDGAVYEWDPQSGRRTGENVLKSCGYSDLTLSPDGKTTFAVGSDKTVKEIADSQILREVDCESMTLMTVALSHTGRMLFAGSSTGLLLSFRFPLSLPGEWQEHQLHGDAITKMRVSYDDQYLLTCAADACVCLWKISEKEGRVSKKESELQYSAEILITRAELEEKNETVAELRQRCYELQMETAYQLRLREMRNSEKVKELQQTYAEELEGLKQKMLTLKAEQEKLSCEHEESSVTMVSRHAQELRDLESAMNAKLIIEYDKHQKLEDKFHQMQQGYERQTQEKEVAWQKTKNEQVEQYEAKLKDQLSALEQCHQDSQQQVREHEEMRRLIEEDADREILDVRNNYERKLCKEKDTNVRLRGETGIMKKKFISLQKEIDDHKSEIYKLQCEHHKFQGVIHSLEKDICGLKKEIQERDETIQDKEKRIYDLKKKNQELEKFKFVLDYKIKELKSQIEPREKEIEEVKKQIQEMENELEQFHKANVSLELQVKELQLKLKASDADLQRERRHTQNLRGTVQRIKADLHNCVGHIQDPKMLKDSIKAMYNKHGAYKDEVKELMTDKKAEDDFLRQREFLERTLSSYRQRLRKDSQIHRINHIKIMQENVTLIAEVNKLRKELKVARTHIRDLESALGLSHRCVNPAEAQKKMQSLLKKQESVKEEHRAEIQSREVVTDLQQREIQQLQQQIQQQQEIIGQLKGSPSRPHLPPVLSR